MLDFAERQQHAKAQSKKLACLFALAVVVVVGATTFAFSEFAYSVIAIFRFHRGDSLQQADFDVSFSTPLLLTIAGFTTLTIVCGSLWKIWQLRAGGGGRVIAEDMGGVKLNSAGDDPGKKRLLNVVEEMAIAFNVPTPQVYLLEKETGINAFAAGYDSEHAVVGVTRGCVDKLKRDQLQGVIAHEFSHIVNGDMRISIQMVGVLHGILMIYILGEQLTRYGWGLISESRTSYGHQYDDGRDWFIRLMALMLGTLLLGVGMLGALCGSLIQSAMSRQREFLADAAAVDLTRNPDGIGGALKVIGGFERGCQLKAQTTEVSHMLFADDSFSLVEMLASHPPLEERILTIDPSWDGSPEFEAEENITQYVGAYDQALGLVGGSPQPSNPSDRSVTDKNVDQDIDRHATPMFQDGSEAHRQFVNSLKESLPKQLLRPLQEEAGAIGMALAFLMPSNERRQQFELNIIATSDPDMAELTKLFCKMLEPLDDAQRFLLLDETERAIQSENCTLFGLEKLVAQLTARWDDDEWLQWSAHRMFFRRIVESKSEWPPKPRFGSATDIQKETQLVLSAVVQCGGSDAAMANYTYQRGAVHSGLQDTDFVQVTGPNSVEQAISKVAELSPRAKRSFLIACGACLAADLDVSSNEAAIMRGICSSLNSPIPDLYPGQRVLPGA